MPSNERRTSRQLWWWSAGCAVAAVVLLTLRPSMPRSFLVFSLAIFSVMGTLLAALLAHFFAKTALRYERLVAGEGRLVEWLVDEAAWKRFRALDGEASKQGLKVGRWLFRLIAAIFGVASVAVWVDDPGAVELSVLFVLIGVGFALGGWSLERSVVAFAEADESPSPASIGRDGVAFRGRFTAFHGFGVRYSGAVVDEKNAVLRVRYVVSGGDVEAEHEVRVPIPEGKLDEAFSLVKRLS